jgi:hypothetical protein
MLRVKLSARSAEVSADAKKRTGVEITVLAVSVREIRGNSRIVNRK